MKTFLILLVSLTPLITSAQQTTAQDSLLDRMIGEWVLQGTIAETEITHDVVIDWVLGHQYVRIKETSREKDLNGKSRYEATVFICWEQRLNQYSCLWLDNTGNGGLSAQAIAHAKADGDKIGLLSKGIDSSLFHTTFAYNRDTDTWRWIMDGEENGNLQPFARVVLTRK